MNNSPEIQAEEPKSPVLNLEVLEKSKSYKDIQLIRKLEMSNFPVCVVFSPTLNKHMIMKLYPYSHKSSRHYIRGCRVHGLSHPNIIRILETDEKRSFKLDNQDSICSVILMELAPFQSLYSIVQLPAFRNDEKLVRTYFHQLIDAVEYCHSNGIAHMDLKLENIVLGKNYELKLIDFDSCYYIEEDVLVSTGSRNYRAPELMKQKVKDPQACDIYSCGVIVFCMMFGALPYDEESLIDGMDIWELMKKQDEKFWKIHEKYLDLEGIDKDFQELFMSMVADNPKERVKLEQLKENSWFKKEIYDEKEMKRVVHKDLKLKSMSKQLKEPEKKKPKTMNVRYF